MEVIWGSVKVSESSVGSQWVSIEISIAQCGSVDVIGGQWDHWSSVGITETQWSHWGSVRNIRVQWSSLGFIGA